MNATTIPISFENHNGVFIFDCNACWRLIEIMYFYFKPPTITSDIFKCLSSDFADHIRKMLEDNNYPIPLKDSFMLCIQGRLFRFQNNLQIEELKPYDSYNKCSCGIVCNKIKTK